MFFNNKNILIICRAKNPFGRVEILYKFAISVQIDTCKFMLSLWPQTLPQKKYLNGILAPAKKVIFILQTLI